MGLEFSTASTRETNKGTDFRTGVSGNRWYKEFEFSTTNNQTPAYATGGIDLDSTGTKNTKFGMARVDQVDIENKGGFVFRYDTVNDKILMYSTGASNGAILAEEAAGAPAVVTYVKGVAWGQI